MKGYRIVEISLYRIVVIALLVIVQIFLFVVIWDSLVSIAGQSGRVLGGTHFSRRTYNACLMFLVSSGASLVQWRPRVRWTVVFGFLFVWSLSVTPLCFEFPNRSRVFWLLGSLILVSGSGIIAPFLVRLADQFGARPGK
ncbi:MAG: hypothetical protein ACI8XO_003169 [Verrucomicrobiales bacterium]|jgi:hypothetical protein